MTKGEEEDEVVGCYRTGRARPRSSMEIVLRSSEEWVLKPYLTIDTLEAVESQDIQEIVLSRSSVFDSINLMDSTPGEEDILVKAAGTVSTTVAEGL